MSTAQLKTLGDFIELQNRNALTHTIRAAVELGIIQSLMDGQKTVKQLAEELSLSPEPLQRLMNVLLETELLERYNDDYALSTIARLIPTQFLDFGDEHWKHLGNHIRSGISLPADVNLPHEDDHYFANKASQEWMLTPAALDAAQVLDVGKSRRGLRILEIGCGSAVFGITLAHRDPDSVVNLLDDAVGLERAKKTVESVGLDRQSTLIESETWLDLESVPELEGESFDLVVVAGIIHRLNGEALKKLLGQLHALVKPERELVLIDVFPGQEAGDSQRFIFELELGLRSSSGQLHDPKELEAALTETGFDEVQYAHLPAAPNYWGLMLAQRST